jgi:Sigma-70 region 2
VPEFDAWLVKRAAAGDQAAFARLIRQSKARIHGLISCFVNSDYQLEREDAYQIVCTAAWGSVQRGEFNPNHGDFYAFVSVAARHRLITYAQHLRAEKRWTGTPPASIEVLQDGPETVELGSWVTFVDPLRVVLARDELRRCMALTTELQRAAIADYLARDGRHLPDRTMHAMTNLRKKVRPMLADPYGRHPTLSPDRRCRQCGRPLAGEDIRATVHRECRRVYQWRRELVDHAAARQVPALRLV